MTLEAECSLAELSTSFREWRKNKFSLLGSIKCLFVVVLKLQFVLDLLLGIADFVTDGELQSNQPFVDFFTSLHTHQNKTGIIATYLNVKTLD